jgi:hypothetical protein
MSRRPGIVQVAVIPAKAGIQGALDGLTNVDSRLTSPSAVEKRLAGVTV